jgi:hypothetical protein
VRASDPIFIAEFESGHETCTAVFCPPDKLNFARGAMLARRTRRRLLASALSSIRTRASEGRLSDEEAAAARRLNQLLSQPLKIVAGRFELNGVATAFAAPRVAAAL